MKFKMLALLILALLGSQKALARVFDFKSEHVAVYVGGTFGSSNASDSAYGASSGSTTVTDKEKKATTAISGEAGLFMSFSKFNLLIGGEYLMPRDQKGVTGSDASGTKLFSVDSSVSAFIPEAKLEFLPYKGTVTRAIFGLGYGVAIAYIDNQYTMTSAGRTAFGVNDFKESASGIAPLMEGYLGFEFLFTDTATATILGGYRYCNVQTFKSTEDTTAITGAQHKGDDIINSDGGPRSINLGGGFVGVNFRFYL